MGRILENTRNHGGVVQLSYKIPERDYSVELVMFEGWMPNPAEEDVLLNAIASPH